MQGQNGTVLEWLDKNAKLFGQLIKTLDVKVTANTVATLLVPSDKVCVGVWVWVSADRTFISTVAPQQAQRPFIATRPSRRAHRVL
jgi:hypothetical protein